MGLAVETGAGVAVVPAAGETGAQADKNTSANVARMK